ncbi:Serine/threonine kinase [Cryptotrichosporon argae]
MSHPSTDPKINTLLQTIQSERRNLEGAKAVVRAVEASSRNEAVIQQAKNEVRAAEASIRFLQDELDKLQLAAGRGTPVGAPNSANPLPGSQGRAGYVPPPGAAPSPSPSRGQINTERPLPPPPPGADNAEPKRQNAGPLDLIKYDAPLTGAKITRMLNQLQFKLQVEEQYKLGIEKMAQAYRAEGDKRLRSETDAKRVESEGKIQLLKKAKKRYETLAKFGNAVEEVDEFQDEGKRKEALRKPISGRLIISLRAARDLNHRALSRRSSRAANETTVVIKIEGNERAVSHPSRTDRWLEDFDIPVEKANEVELTIYDTVAPGDTAPVGMLWLRVSDLMDALRRQKVEAEVQNAGWVTADAAAAATRGPSQGRAGAQEADSMTLHGAGVPRGPGGQAMGARVPQPDGIETWFSVEPAGAIQLRLDFVKDTAAGGRRPYEALGRQGAVRKRKGDVYEMNGHKFVQRQFYQPIMCALCQEFLLTGEGYQCEDCRYACHKKCYPKVVTKCISKSNADGEGDEEKINHRIPHRFTAYTNMSANWCCHCGYMLPLGRKNAVKCSECALTCHQTCSHFVPDFCGMTMEMANILLTNLRAIKTTQTAKSKRPAPPSDKITPATSTSSTSSVSTLPQYQPAAPMQAPLPPPQQRPQPATNDQRAPGQPGPPVLPPIPHSQSFTDYNALRPATQSSAAGRPLPGPPPPASRTSYDGGYVPPPPPQQRVPPGAQVAASGYVPPAPPPMQQQYHPPPQPQPPQPPQPVQRPPTTKRRVGLDDFNFLAVLGKGNFGKVMLAEERQSNNLYAIKVLKKEFIIENDEVESTQSEKRVFLAAAQERHPFLLGLHSCFQTETRVYFVMEYVSGGDLMLHIQKKQFTLRQAKFYACEVLLALEYFHAKGIVYRDLKLDNILLTLDGHVKVADYGLCKEGMWYGKTTATFCGTPEFMAPEILLEQRYGRAVDWWAFGVLTYEMLLGQSPFRGDDEDEIFDAILEDEPLYPITMPSQAVSLLQALLQRDPARRLGAGENDAADIKRQAFFADVNFDDVYHKKIPPPYFPQIGNATDVSNFDQEFTREQPTLTPVHTQLTAANQQEFAGFSWIAPWAAAQ